MIHITAYIQTARDEIKAALARFWQAIRPGPETWTGAAAGVLLVALLFVAISLIEGPFVPAWVWVVNFIKMLVLAVLLPILGAQLALMLIDLIGKIPFGFRWRTAAAAGMILSFTSMLSRQGQVIVIVLLVIAGAMVGSGIWASVRSRNSLTIPRRILAATWAVLGSAALMFMLVWYAGYGQAEADAPNAAALAGQPHTLVSLPDPSQPGPYAVKTLTYGSGSDPFRPEFGAAVDWKSQSVNGSSLLNDSLGDISRQLRRMVWGFDFDSLPVNGRVWMPDSESGPFPLVLMVHGNHSATDFSDPGYAYLGELLASRGFLFVSVDQNFLNGAFTDFFESIKNENDARGWLLLEHISQFNKWNQDPASPFYQKVDLQRIAVSGHSRGGEAAAVAAAFNRLPNHPENGLMTFDYDFNIRAVISIAPIDGQYMPGDRATVLQDVNYLVIQGSHDADVWSFDGLNQYERVRFTGGDWFKSALYIYRANHGQFNSVWGDSDYGSFARGLLNRGALVSKQDQQQIAKVYISAFLEAALFQKDGYRPLLQDARSASQTWLPANIYINRYDASGDRLFATFDEDINLRTLSENEGQADGKNLKLWGEKRIPTRWGPGENGVVILGWNEDSAEYILELPDLGLDLTGGDQFIFAMSDANQDPAPAENDSNAETPKTRQPADLTLVLEDSYGQKARVALSSRMMVQPQLVVLPWKTELLFRKPDSEPVLQSYTFPLSAFLADNPGLSLSDLRAVHFVFDITPRSSVILDAIGFRRGNE